MAGRLEPMSQSLYVVSRGITREESLGADGSTGCVGGGGDSGGSLHQSMRGTA